MVQTENEIYQILAAVNESQWRVIVRFQGDNIGNPDGFERLQNGNYVCKERGGVNTLREAAECLESTLEAANGGTNLGTGVFNTEQEFGNTMIRTLARIIHATEMQDNETDLTQSNAENLLRIEVRTYQQDARNNRLQGSYAVYGHESLGQGTGTSDPTEGNANPVDVIDYEANWITYLGYVPQWVHNYFYNVIGKQDEKWVG